MKKMHFPIRFLILVSLAFSLAACAQPIKPSRAAINRAVSWAQSCEGDDSFPFSNGWGDSPSYLKCTLFVSNAYGFECPEYSAYLLWYLTEQKHPGDWNAPRGSLVFFDRNDYNIGLGHVALSLGNGNIIEAGYPIIIKNTLRGESSQADYLGWAWPPSDWPGRSGGSPAILISIILVILSAFGLLIILIKRKRKAAHSTKV